MCAWRALPPERIHLLVKDMGRYIVVDAMWILVKADVLDHAVWTCFDGRKKSVDVGSSRPVVVACYEGGL